MQEEKIELEPVELAWEPIGTIVQDGTILSLAASVDGAWIGSPAGLFKLDQPTLRVRPMVEGVPFASVNALYATDRDVLAAGLPHGIIRSTNNGRDWIRCTVEQSDKPITCLAGSPKISQDGIVLAGTAGDGIMRSTDRGRFWDMSSYGMANRDVLALACAPTWATREYAVAGTAEGVYWSANGGRAWKAAEMPAAMVVQTVCFSPRFADDQVVYAGSEENGLLVSDDAGKSWQRDSGIPADRSITWLGVVANLLYAGSGRGELWQQQNDSSWRTVDIGAGSDSRPAILAGCGVNDQLLLGLVDEGLAMPLASKSGQLPQQRLRRFVQMSVSGSRRIAVAINDHLYVSRDYGRSWGAVPGSGIHAAQLFQDRLLALQNGKALLNGTPLGGVQMASCLATSNSAAVVGCGDGRLWNVDIETDSPQPVQTAWPAAPIAAVAVTDAGSMAAAIVNRDQKEIVFCVRSEGTNGKWKVVGRQLDRGASVRLALSADGQLLCAVYGGNCIIFPVVEGDAHQISKTELSDATKPLITVLAAKLESAFVFMCATFDQLFVYDGDSWRPISRPSNVALADLAALHSGHELTLELLSVDGEVWRATVPM